MASVLMIAMWTLPVGFAIVRAKCVSQLLLVNFFFARADPHGGSLQLL